MSKRMKGTGKALLCLLLPLLLLGCGPKETPLTLPGETEGAAQTAAPAETAQPEEEGFVLRACLGSEMPQTLDPALSVGLDTHSCMALLYEGLYRYGADGQVLPGAAESAEVSADGLTWTLHLRPDACWSDGTKLTAQDFVYAFRRAVAPELDAVYGYDLSAYFLNGEAVALGEKAPEELGAQALDEETLELRLLKPCDYLDEVLAHPCLSPVKEGQEPDAACTNGPYVLGKQDGQSLTLIRSETYTGGAAAEPEEICLLFGDARRLLDAGEADLALEQEVFGQGLTVRRQARTGTRALVFNLNKGCPTADAALRKALLLCVDTEAAAAALADGSFAALSLVGPGVDVQDGRDFFTEGGPLLTDTAERMRGQGEALLMDAWDGRPIRLLAYGDDKIVRLAQSVADGWRELLGVETELLTPDFEEYLDLFYAGDFDVSLWALMPDFSSPLPFLSDFASGNFGSVIGYEDESYDALLEQAVSLGTRSEEGRALLHEAERRLIEDGVLCPLTHYAVSYTQRETLDGVSLTHSGICLLGGAHVKE